MGAYVIQKFSQSGASAYSLCVLPVLRYQFHGLGDPRTPRAVYWRDL